MYLTRTLSKRTCHDGCTADVFKLIVDNHTLVGIVLKIKGGGSEVLESAFSYVDMTGISDCDGADGAFYPCLIFQPTIPRQSLVLLELIGINQRKSAL